MKQFLQIAGVFFMLVLAIMVYGAITSNQTVNDNRLSQMMNEGDMVTIRSETSLNLEATGDDEFTFIAGGVEIINSYPFADEFNSKSNISKSDLRIVKGNARVVLESEKPSTFTYYPGKQTRNNALLVMGVCWALASMLFVWLFEELLD